MVSIDVSQGAELLETLERANVKVSVALWMFLSEFEDWRLVISSRQFDTPDPRDAYRRLHDSLSGAMGMSKKNSCNHHLADQRSVCSGTPPDIREGKERRRDAAR